MIGLRLAVILAITDNSYLRIHIHSRIRSLLFLPLTRPHGDKGIRTPDLRRAKASLSHLSYVPVWE